MPTALHRHERAVADRFGGHYGGHAPLDLLVRALDTPLGNYLVNTPLYLLAPQINLQAKHRLLEVGCARGANLRFLAARIGFREPPVGLDLCRPALRAGACARHSLPFAFVQGSASRLPFGTDSFDLILAAHVVRHLTDEGVMRLLVEGQRVLRPGGLVALWEFAPTASMRLNRLNAGVLDALGGCGQLRGFGRLAYFAAEAGYVVIERPRLRPFLFPPVPRTALLAKKAGGDPTPAA